MFLDSIYMSVDYFQKYMKYKNKYIQLKGGSNLYIYPLQELNNSLNNFKKQIECCLADFQNTHNELKMTRDALKIVPENMDINLSIQAIDIIIRYLQEWNKNINVKQLTITAKDEKETMEFFDKNFVSIIHMIVNNGRETIQKLYDEITIKNIPYMTLVVRKRDANCDTSLKSDCFLNLYNQGIVRISLPLKELENMFKKANKTFDTLALMNQFITKSLQQINGIISKIRTYNKTKYGNENIVFNIGEVMDDVKCNLCDQKTSRFEKKKCCQKPCNFSFIKNECKL